CSVEAQITPHPLRHQHRAERERSSPRARAQIENSLRRTQSPRLLDEYLDLFQGPRRLLSEVLRQVSRRRNPPERDGALGRHLWGHGNQAIRMAGLNCIIQGQKKTTTLVAIEGRARRSEGTGLP